MTINTTNIDGALSDAIVSTYKSIMDDYTSIGASWIYSDRTYELIPTHLDGTTKVEFKITICDIHMRKMTICDIHDVTGIYVDGQGLTVVSDTTSYTVGVFGDYTMPYVPLDKYRMDMTDFTSLGQLRENDRVFATFTKDGVTYNMIGCKVVSVDDGDVTFTGLIGTGTTAIAYAHDLVLPIEQTTVTYGWYSRR